MSIHAVKREQANLAWDNSIPPVLMISSGSTVHFSCLDASNGQLNPTSTNASIAALKIELCDQVNGPVYVKGAAPGDTLQIDVLDVKTADWGWTALIPGFGLMADEFPEPAIKIWDLTEQTVNSAGEVEKYAYLNKDRRIRVQLRPFAGEMGVARGERGAWSTIPPYVTGGNLDTKHLTKDATLYLPVEVEGALFAIGDGHAAQGDGGTAIETPMEVTVRLTVRKDKPYTKTPHFRTVTPQANAEEYYCTTGIDTGEFACVSKWNGRVQMRAFRYSGSDSFGSSQHDRVSGGRAWAGPGGGVHAV
ncbi:Formamidase [Boletus reticuloceps]|uniref:Formamidase n=1 Tax=Boletus reticuloceps TaxID=495285 RepID=A0A8I3A7J0_9AGAM|nr:Formamidase [Boletus reticuloceps]